MHINSYNIFNFNKEYAQAKKIYVLRGKNIFKNCRTIVQFKSTVVPFLERHS